MARLYSRVLFVVFLLMLFSSRSQGQSQNLTATVVDDQKGFVEGASVSLYAYTDSLQLLTYTQTNGKGAFTFQDLTFPLRIKIRSLAFRAYSKLLHKPSDLPAQIQLEPRLIAIDQVIVNMNKGFATFREDTINYNLAALNLRDNESLKEILARIPGFAVDANHRIVHNGREINKIMVNGKEVFEYQNKIALENMEAGMLEGLKVVNNYKNPFQINLAGENEEKVIDLKLKKSFTSLVKGNVDASLGYKEKYKVKPFLFFFGKGLAAFSLTNFNNLSDKDWSSEDFNASNQALRMDSRYFSNDDKEIFYNKDITLSAENVLLNATTLRTNTDKFSLQSVLNFNHTSARRLSDLTTRYNGSPFYEKYNADSTKANMFSAFVDLRYLLFSKWVLKNLFSTYTDRFRRGISMEANYVQEDGLLSLREKKKYQSSMLSNRFELETKFWEKTALFGSWTARREIAEDHWFLPELSNQGSDYRPFDFRLLSTEHTFATGLRHLIGRGKTLSFKLTYQRMDNELDEVRSAQQIDILSFNVDGNLKYKYLHARLDFRLSQWEAATPMMKKQHVYPTGTVDIDVFFDAYKKNKVNLLYRRDASLYALKRGLGRRVISYDLSILGDYRFLTDMYSVQTYGLSYVYNFPFKGQYLSIALNRQEASRTIIETIVPNAVFFRQYREVKGWQRNSIEGGYSQNVKIGSLPLHVKLDYTLSDQRSYQLDGEKQVGIKQQGHLARLNFNSFAASAVNFILNSTLDYNNLKYGGLSSTDQYNTTLAFGPRYQAGKLTSSVLAKYSFLDNREEQNSFFDLDMNAEHSISKRIVLTFRAENLLENLGFKKDGSLSMMSNDQGFEYYQTFRNIIGYTSVGFRFKL